MTHTILGANGVIEVCCRPMQLTVTWDESGTAHAEAITDEDG